MRVVKIKKSYCNGIIEYYLIISDFEYFQSDELINYHVEDWCKDEPSGHGNGYSYTWEHVTNTDEIIAAIDIRLKNINNKISSLKTEKDELLEEYSKYTI